MDPLARLVLVLIIVVFYVMVYGPVVLGIILLWDGFRNKKYVHLLAGVFFIALFALVIWPFVNAPN